MKPRFCMAILVGVAVFVTEAQGQATKLLHTTLDDPASVTAPLVGTGSGAVIATTPANDFVPGQSGNGIRINAAQEYLRLPQTDGAVQNVELDQGTVEFWYQPAYAHSDGVSHRIFGLGDKNQPGSMGLYKRVTFYGNDLYLIIHDATGTGRETTVAGTNYSWSAGQWVKLRITWDSTVAAGVQNVRIYLDDIERQYGSASTGSFLMPAESTTQHIWVGSLSANETNTASGVIDELKIFAGTGSSGSSDTIPPTVALLSPNENRTLSGTVVLWANAFDNASLAGVQFMVDGGNVGAEDNTAPFSVSLDTNTLSDGPHTITVEARDGAGNVTTSVPVNVIVNNSTPVRPYDVVLVVTDDQRWDTMQYMPLISAHLSGATIQFDNAFASTPLCCPSRASILSGLYSHNTGVIQNYAPNGGASLFKDASTLVTWLQQVGYRTGIFGKYMNEYYRLSPYVPPGWDEWHVFVSNVSGSDSDLYHNYLLNDNGVVSTYGSTPQDYSTDVLTAKAVQYIQAAPAGQPLFLYFVPYAPHDPFTPAASDVGTFSSLPPWRPPSYNEADVSDKPSWVQQLPLLSPSQSAASDAIHQSQVESLQAVDRGVDAILSALASAGRLANTIVIFTSDHGMSWGEHRWLDDKTCVYEECLRPPLWVRVPAAVSRNEPRLALNVDLAPSIAEWAGFVPPSSVNGLSFAGLIGNTSLPWREEVLIEHLGGASDRSYHAVRTTQYVYVEYVNGEREFYDLASDPYQLTNVVNNPAYASVISALQALLNVLRGT